MYPVGLQRIGPLSRYCIVSAIGNGQGHGKQFSKNLKWYSACHIEDRKVWATKLNLDEFTGRTKAYDHKYPVPSIYLNG